MNNIEYEFKPGDTVFAINNDGIRKSEVMQVNIVVGDKNGRKDFNRISYSLKVVENTLNGITYEKYSEEVFPTKKKLIKSL